MVATSVSFDQRDPIPLTVIAPADPPSSVTGRTEVFPPPAGVAITYARHAKSSVPSKETAMLPEAFVKSTKLAPSPYGARLGSLFVLAGTTTLTGWLECVARVTLTSGRMDSTIDGRSAVKAEMSCTYSAGAKALNAS